MATQKPDSVFALSDIIDRVRRGKLKLFACVAVSLILVLIYNYKAKPVYRASAIMAVEEFSKDNILNVDIGNALYKANFIANRIQEIKTPAFAQKVYEVLPDSIRGLFRLPDDPPPGFDKESFIIQKIEASVLATSSEKASNMIVIACDSENPVLAKTIVNTVTQVLQRINLESRRKEFTNLRQFIDEQIAVVEERLEKAENTLQAFRSQANITSLDVETGELLQRITEAENLHTQIKTKKEATEKKLNLIHDKLAEQKKEFSDSVSSPLTPLVAKMKEQLIDLEVQYSNLRVQKYPEDHPKMVKLKSEISQLREKIINTTREIFREARSDEFIDPIAQFKNYVEESIALEIEYESLLAQEKSLKETLAAYNERLSRLSTQENTLYGLLRDREISNKNYIQLLEEREQARLREAAEIGNIQVIEAAETPLTPYQPRKLVNIVMALIAGTFLGIILIFLNDSISDVPRSREALEKILKLPVISSIPKLSQGGMPFIKKADQKGVVMNNGATANFYRDAYSYLWNHLQLSRIGKAHKVILVTSAVPGEGKSTIASNLAITCARLGDRTILIDGDIRKPTVQNIFARPISPGLTNLFSQAMEVRLSHAAKPFAQESLNEIPSFNAYFKAGQNFSDQPDFVSQTTAVIQPAAIEGLQIITAGNGEVEPDILWNSPVLKEIISFLKQTYEIVIIDMPPLLGIPDALFIAPHVDQVLLCVAAEQADKRTLIHAQNLLEQSNCQVSGVVWNKVDPVFIYGKNRYYKYYLAQKKV